MSSRPGQEVAFVKASQSLQPAATAAAKHLRKGEGASSGQSPAKDQPYVVARCAMNAEDTISMILVMTASMTNQLFVMLFILVPPMMLTMFILWQWNGVVRTFENSKEPISFEFYKPSGVHAPDAAIEYIIIFTMFMFTIIPRAISLYAATRQLFRFIGLWRQTKSYRGRMLFNGFICILVNKMLFPVGVVLLSGFIAFYSGDSTSLLLVLMRILLFDFLSDLATPIITQYLNAVHPTKTIEIQLHDVVFRNNFWKHSFTTENDVRDALVSTTDSTNASLLGLTLMSRDWGMGLSTAGGTTCRIVLKVGSGKEREETLVPLKA